MNKEELIKFLKENLSINVIDDYDPYSRRTSYTIELDLCGETISQANFSVEN